MKSILVILTLTLISTTSFCQEKLSFGSRVGYQVSQFKGERHTGYSLGLYAGGFIQYHLSSGFSLEFDALYSEQGGSRLTIKENPPGLDIPISRETITSNVSLKTIEFPLLINYAPWPGLQAKPHFIAGPSFTFLAAAFDKRDITLEYNPLVYTPIPDPVFGSKIITSTVSDKENVTHEYQRFGLGANAGLGLNIPFTRFNMIIDLKYRIGITPIDVSFNPLNKVSNSSQLKNNSIIFSIAFTLKK